MAKRKPKPLTRHIGDLSEVPTWEMLDQFSRAQLRDFAKSLGVPTGSDKNDVIRNLLDSGKVVLSISLGG